MPCKKTQNNQQEIIMIELVKVGFVDKLSEDFLEKLKVINRKYAKKQLSYFSYAKELRNLFGVDKNLSITNTYKQFLGGFILGEGSLNSSLKKQEVSLSVALDLEFSVTQSVFGVSHLINLILVFHTGRLEYKSGSNATLVFKISNRQIIFEKVFPFWEEYILPYQTTFEAERFRNFKKFENLFNRKVHLNKMAFLNEMLPLWDSLRKQKGQTNQSFESLKDAQNYVNKKSFDLK